MRAAAVSLLCLSLCACSIKRMAVNKVGDALSSGGSVYETDDDLELVGAALPFGLKLIESLLAESPRHKGLLQSACQGFTTYAYLYVQCEADEVAAKDFAAGEALRARARRLFLRGHRYGYRGLEAAAPGIGARMLADPRAAVAAIRKKADVPLLYWNAAALGLAISVSKSEAGMLARLPEVEALVERALELDEGWQEGTLHEFKVTLAAAKPGKPDFDRLEKHYRRAQELSGGKRAGLFVAYAESCSVPKQDAAGFRAALEKALAIDADRHETLRLANVAAQRRARWLLERTEDLILTAEPESGEEKK